MMNDVKQAPEKPIGTDGQTLDIVVDENEQLPHGLERLRSGMIVVTRLFCPNGHNLVDTTGSASFNGYPGIMLLVEGAETSGKVIISPIHGDDTKFGETDFEPGELTRVKCPTCEVELPPVQPCGCTDDAQLLGLYLDDSLEHGNQVALCQTWGCLRSRIMDRFQIISKFE